MDNIKKNILDKLNDEQKLPAQDHYGPQFLIAGAGSGKTFCVIARTQLMLLEGILPESILLFSFTNKAAKEIKERIAKAVGDDIAKRITTGTYHSFCFRLLREYGTNLGYNKSFSIFDSDDQKKSMKKALKDSDIDINMLSSYISNQKRKLISPQKAMENSAMNRDELAKYYGEYQKDLFNQNAMDFDDLIFNTIKLLSKFQEIKVKVNKRWQYLTADEFQDSSNSDIELLRLLAGGSKNICVVGDDSQSIFGFRGADIDAVLSITNVFQDMKYYNLNHNYRSSNTIVEASKSLIKNNVNQLKKQIFTNNEDGDKIILFEENNPQMEAVRIAKMIQLLIKKYNYKHEDIAILYRTSAQSRSIEEAFLKYQIPYEILSGINFYARKEIKDIVSFIKFLSNPYDLSAFSRIINIPKRGIGAKTLELIVDECNEHYYPLDAYSACKNLLEANKFKGKAKKGIEQFLIMIKSLADIMNDRTVPELISEIIKASNYYQYLKDEDEETFDDKHLNIIELIELSYSYNSLDEFLEQTSLNRKEDDFEESKTQLLTMHMSKGLEWKVVFCIGINEGTNPHFMSLSSEKAIEEERRLFYVGITRAKNNLFLTRAKKIQRNGYYMDAKASRFLSEIDSEYIYSSERK